MPILYFAAAISILIFWAAAISALINAIRKQKTTAERYSFWDILSYILDVPLLVFFVFQQVIFAGIAIALPQEGWELLLGNVITTVGGFLVPGSVWTIAKSISLRKEGKPQASFLMQFSSIPVYFVFLACAYLIL